MTNPEFIKFHDSILKQIQTLTKTLDDFSEKASHKDMEVLVDALWEARHYEQNEVTAQFLSTASQVVEMIHNADS